MSSGPVGGKVMRTQQEGQGSVSGDVMRGAVELCL